MVKVIGGVVEQRRIVVDAPDDWPDGTEVHVYLVCRAGLTTKDSPRNGAEMIAIDQLIEAEKRGAAIHES
jgi:hypothetical protein